MRQCHMGHMQPAKNQRMDWKLETSWNHPLKCWPADVSNMKKQNASKSYQKTQAGLRWGYQSPEIWADLLLVLGKFRLVVKAGRLMASADVWSMCKWKPIIWWLRPKNWRRVSDNKCVSLPFNLLYPNGPVNSFPEAQQLPNDPTQS
jgi:hypothetical protein